MPRAGVSAGRYDDGWDWIDPQREGDSTGGEGWNAQAYYDWSKTGDFRHRPRPRAALRAVPDPAPGHPPARTAPLERAVRAAAPTGPDAARAEPPSDPVVSVRRTITITGHGAERYMLTTPRRTAARSYERSGFRPDRIAMWAVLLGVLMVLAAATSAHAALLHP